MTNSEQAIVAEAPGVRITARARGAHLMSWTTNGVERLWMSPLSRIDQPGALRGGVPVLFPQFGTFGDLPKHGFARTADWEQIAAPDEPDRATLAFQLTDSQETRDVWPHEFRARLFISASATELTVALLIDNQARTPIQFTGGLHNYLAVADPEAWIEGLAGCFAWDGASTTDPAFTVRVGKHLPALVEQDLVVRGAIAPVVLHDKILSDLRIAARGFSNRVVWNPGPEHELADVAAGDESGFVCIEPVDVRPVVLPGGGAWEGRQRLHLP